MINFIIIVFSLILLDYFWLQMPAPTFMLTIIAGECYVDITAWEEECKAIIKTKSSKGPKLIKNINFWKDTDVSKYARNQNLIESLLDDSESPLFGKTLALLKNPVNQANKLCVDFVLSHVKSNTSGVHLCKVLHFYEPNEQLIPPPSNSTFPHHLTAHSPTI